MILSFWQTIFYTSFPTKQRKLFPRQKLVPFVLVHIPTDLFLLILFSDITITQCPLVLHNDFRETKKDFYVSYGWPTN